MPTTATRPSLLTDGHPILSGPVTHPGTDHATTVSVHAMPARIVAGLRWTRADDTATTPDGDTTVYEIRHALRLALLGNDQLLSLLWTATPTTRLAGDLVAIRDAVVSTRAVRRSYLAAGGRDLRRLRRALGDPTADEYDALRHAARAEAHFRRGRQLLTTGALTPDPDIPLPVDPRKALAHLRSVREEFGQVSSCLPDAPDIDRVAAYLDTIRRAIP